MASGADTQRHTHIPTREPKQFQETRSVRPKAMRAWFKNFVENQLFIFASIIISPYAVYQLT